MGNNFDAKTWFVENESKLVKEAITNNVKSNVNKQSTNSNINIKKLDDSNNSSKNVTSFQSTDILKPFENIINTETKITSKMSKKFTKKLNPNLCSIKKILGAMTIITIFLGALTAIAGMPAFLLLTLGFTIAYIIISNRVSTIRKTIIALKTPENFELYYNNALTAKYNDLPFKYDERAVYNDDNAIFSIDNICLIYTVGKKVYFGTIKGEPIKFGKSLSQENQKSLINILKTANPNILVGSEYIEVMRRLIGS